MQVCIGSPGRFHTFDLACQMERLGHLARMYTGYPRSKVEGLPREKVRSFPWLMTPSMALARFGLGSMASHLNYFVVTSFDKWLASHLEKCEIFHCLSSFGLASQKMAKKRYGTLTVCDRGSSHIQYQRRILAEEYDRFGVPFAGIDQRIIERELAEYAGSDLIFVPSTFVWQTFIQEGVPANKLCKNPYGVDLGVFRRTQKEDDVFRIVYVGAISLRKGIPYLLRAVAGLKLPKFELWLIGAVQSEARKFLADYDGCYRYLGAIPRSELYRYYGQGSVFVIASIEEGLALVQAQAMACGLPVIATVNTGCEDLFTDGVEGFVVPVRDPEAIRDRVLELYDDPELRDQMSQAALRRVRLMNGCNDYGDRAARFYAEALHQREDR
jgi:alpha-maltose-1-phosphate synthase